MHVLVLSCLVGLKLVSCEAGPQVDRLEKPEIKGKWVVEYRIIEGMKIEAPPGLNELYSFSGHELVYSVNMPGLGDVTQRMRAEYPSKTEPIGIDLYFEGSSEPCRGIYKIENNKLIVVLNLAGLSRPKKFEGFKTSNLDENFVLMVLKEQ